mmetsp:Transcript_8274/g.20361  ORF Transcript_8274/g.20361 Transcript_8274/m.20361 type:complete len:505 (-) Transcript_8274:56-1570(-)
MDSTCTTLNTPETAIIWKLGLQDHPYASLYVPTLLPYPYRTRLPPQPSEAPSSNAVAVSSSASSTVSDKLGFENRTDTESEKPWSQKCDDGHHTDPLCTTKRNRNTNRDLIQENDVSGNNTNIRKHRRMPSPRHIDPNDVTAVGSSAVADKEKRIDSSAIAEAAKKNNDSNENEKTDNIAPFNANKCYFTVQESVLPPIFFDSLSEPCTDEEASPLYEKTSTPKTNFTKKYKNKEETTKVAPRINTGKIVTVSNKETRNVPFMASGVDRLNRRKMADPTKKLPSIEDMKWFSSYSELVRFKKNHGTSVVPTGDKTYPDLSKWVMSQVCSYRSRTLPKKYEDLLFEIGFRFELATPKSELKWEAMCQRYKSYRATNSNLIVHRINLDDPELANWVTNSRTQVKRNNMTEARQKRLKQLDFKVNFRSNDPWKTMFKQLIAFVERHGKFSEQELMRGTRSSNNNKLRNWVRTQRHKYFTHRLTEDRMQKLASIGVAGWSTFSFLVEK